VTRVEFVARLLALGRRRGEIPIYGSGEWEQLDPVDPRRFAACVRAAECWRQDSEPDAIAARLRAEILETDALIAWRIRRASLDISAAPWWPEYRARLGDKPGSTAGWIKAYEDNARRHRLPRPWTPAELGRRAP
jgi:hypothetical protein